MVRVDSVGYTALSGLGIVVVNQLANLTIKWRRAKSEERKVEAGHRATEQKRKWDLEDQDRKSAQIAKDLAAHTEKQTEKVLEKIQENTVVNLDQINVSNSYNSKIAQNTADIVRLHDRMARIESAVIDIKESLDK